MKTSKCTNICLLIICLFIVFTPWLFTCDAICERLNFTETGNAGDTIGGITAPFIGLLNVILLFITLRAQLDFNKRQAKDSALAHMIELQATMVTCGNNVQIHYCSAADRSAHPSQGMSARNGLSALCDYAPDEVRYFPKSSMKALLMNLQNIVKLGSSLLLIKSESDLNSSIKQEFKGFVQSYFKQIKQFYEEVEKDNIKIQQSALDTFKADDDSTAIDEIIEEIEACRKEIGKLTKTYSLLS